MTSPLSFLQHDFIRSAKPNSILLALIADANEVKLKRQEEAERRRQREARDHDEDDDDDDDNSVADARCVKYCWWKERKRSEGASITSVEVVALHCVHLCNPGSPLLG